jgi:hypothetical protein
MVRLAPEGTPPTLPSVPDVQTALFRTLPLESNRDAAAADAPAKSLRKSKLGLVGLAAGAGFVVTNTLSSTLARWNLETCQLEAERNLKAGPGSFGSFPLAQARLSLMILAHCHVCV